MLDEWLRDLLRRFGRPPTAPDGAHRHAAVDAVDDRLADLERAQREINARLTLLERQADPRGRRYD